MSPESSWSLFRRYKREAAIGLTGGVLIAGSLKYLAALALALWLLAGGQ